MKSLGERLLLKAETSADTAAIYLQKSGKPDLEITYGRLVRGARAYAETYWQAGLLPGEVVVLIFQHGEELVDAFWGAILCGVIPSIMPFLTEKLAPDQYRHDLAALIAVTHPAAVATYSGFEAEVRAALKSGDSVRSVIVAGRFPRDSTVPLGELPGIERSSQDIVLLQHSSGTTGLQKGVALSHAAVLNQLKAYGEMLRINSKDVVVSWLPLYHDMGLIAGFVMPILEGMPLVLSSPFDWVRAPWRLLQAVSRYHGTLSWLPNFAYNFSAQKIRDRDLQGVDLSSWRAVINCSEPVKWESHRAFFERFKGHGLQWQSLQTSYAMAENVFCVTQSDMAAGPALMELDRDALMTRRTALPPSEGHAAVRVMSSGRPLPNTQVRILDEGGHAIPDGNVGEIALQSDCMLTGYYNRPDADTEAFRDGWYLTGDFGFLSGGELYVSGRRKDLIIVGGKNIYPQDLEALSYEVPGVHAGRSVAFGVFNDESGTEDVCMVAEVDAVDPLEQDHIAELIRAHVTKNSAIALKRVRAVGPRWILKTSSGKTARAANRDKFFAERALEDN